MAEEKSNKNKSEDNLDAMAGNGNVDQIRDILFGSQMKDYERKFSRLEERIMSEVTRLKSDSNKRFDVLEEFINKGIDSLSDKLRVEKTDRSESIKELTSELTSTAKGLEKKLNSFEQTTEKDVRELRQSLFDQSKTLLNEIGEKHDEGMAIFDRSVNELRDEKANRSTLSALLTDLAIRLADDSLYEQGE
ncbi:MAG: hypothetical protein COA90_06850 [Gammaproteobacteria bacterium]|nr:MAG: hypothetical protein COA90_06850 [Gammaproteobacteria bacterium]